MPLYTAPFWVVFLVEDVGYMLSSSIPVCFEGVMQKGGYVFFSVEDWLSQISAYPVMEKKEPQLALLSRDE